VSQFFTESTLFSLANILSCYNEVSKLIPTQNSIEVTKARGDLASFLLSQKSPRGSFNYWLRDSEESRTMPYPDDLDDTFVALAALHGFDPSLIDGAVLADVAKLLPAVEIAPGGPYRTWLIEPTASPEWKDVDLVVNSNVAYFLSRIGIHLPNLTKFVDDRIREDNLTSPYYPSVIHVIYFISRFYKGEGRDALVQKVLAAPKENSLKLAMAISALINLGYDPALLNANNKVNESNLMSLLIARIEAEGFTPDPFCIELVRDGKTHYAASPALTAAFCAEAIAKWMALEEAVAKEVAAAKEENMTKGKVAISTSSQPRGHLESVKLAALKRIVSLPENLQAIARAEIEKVKSEEIVAVPFLMYESLREPANKIIVMTTETARHSCRPSPLQIFSAGLRIRSTTTFWTRRGIHFCFRRLISSCAN
jgi:hypothetical protein